MNNDFNQYHMIYILGVVTCGHFFFFLLLFSLVISNASDITFMVKAKEREVKVSEEPNTLRCQSTVSVIQ